MASAGSSRRQVEPGHAKDAHRKASNAQVLNFAPPAVSTLAVSPASLDRLIAACLAKSPDRRWHCAEDLGRALEWIAVEPARAGVPAATGPRSRRWPGFAMVIAAGAALVAMGRLSVGERIGPAEVTPAVHFRVDPPEGTSLLVPDGQRFLALEEPGHDRLAIDVIANWLAPPARP